MTHVCDSPQVYFLTDGEPVEQRTFLRDLVSSQGANTGDKSLPSWLVLALAVVLEAAWAVLPLSGMPPVTRFVVLLLGYDVTISDAKARRELGYTARKSREAGLREMKQAASVGAGSGK